jgi:hypothetical protein
MHQHGIIVSAPELESSNSLARDDYSRAQFVVRAEQFVEISHGYVVPISGRRSQANSPGRVSSATPEERYLVQRTWQISLRGVDVTATWMFRPPTIRVQCHSGQQK